MADEETGADQAAAKPPAKAPAPAPAPEPAAEPAAEPVPAGMIRVRVEPPHSEMHHAGYHIGREGTLVSELAAAQLANAAADAGVTLTQET